MSKFILLTLSLFLAQGIFRSKSYADSKINKIVIAVLDTGMGSPHQAAVVKAIRSNLKKCNDCEIKTFPIYTKNGDLITSQFLKSLKLARQSSQIIHLSWNIPATEKTKSLENALIITAQNKILVASAGAPESETLTGPLSNTVMGHVKEAFLVGEFNDKNQLALNSYYGPEMFTAFTPVKNKHGSSFTSVKLTAAIAEWLSRNPTKTLQDLKSILHKKKANSFAQYPDLKMLGLERY